jgi:hypothetical protein
LIAAERAVDGKVRATGTVAFQPPAPYNDRAIKSFMISLVPP